MSQIKIDIVEPESDNSDAELQEIREELADHVDATEDAIEETAEAVENELGEFKEEVKSWLEKALEPIAAAILSLSGLTQNLAQKVEALEMTELTPLPLTPEISSETIPEPSNSIETEPPESAGEENPVLQEIAETLDNPAQSLAKVIHKL